MKIKIVNLGKVSPTVEEDYWSINKAYNRLTIVEQEGTFTTYISRLPVPKGTPLTNRHYWIPFSTRNAVTISSFIVLSSVSELPLNESEVQGNYIINGTGYFWVGTNGDTADGKYQSIRLEGAKGEDGKSAYDIYIEQGGTKTKDEWLASLKGEKGEKGDPFRYQDFTAEQLAGLRGPEGKPGTDGQPGAPGTPGRDGANGKDGTNGRDGADGKDGHSPVVTIGTDGMWYVDGERTEYSAIGLQGPPGPPGPSSGDGATNIVVTDNEIKVFTDYDPTAVPTLSVNMSTVVLHNNSAQTIIISGSNLNSDVNAALRGNLKDDFEIIYSGVSYESLDLSPNNEGYLSSVISVRYKKLLVGSGTKSCSLVITNPDTDDVVVQLFIAIASESGGINPNPQPGTMDPDDSNYNSSTNHND